MVVAALQTGQSIVAPAPDSSATKCLPQASHLKKMSGIAYSRLTGRITTRLKDCNPEKDDPHWKQRLVTGHWGRTGNGSDGRDAGSFISQQEKQRATAQGRP